MRGILVWGLLVGLLAPAPWAGAGEASSERAVQRTRVLERLGAMAGEMRKAVGVRTEAESRRSWARAANPRSAGLDEYFGTEEQRKALEAALAWLAANEDLMLALQRRQADLFADMVAAGEAP